MLVFQLCSPSIDLRFNETQRGVGFFNDGVVALLWSARDEDIGFVDRCQGIESRAYAPNRCGIITLIAHNYSL